MGQILQTLWELFVESIPTIVILLLFYFVLKQLFFKPLLAAMDERDARTEGARKAAEAAEAAAREKTQQYEEALRKARLAVYAEQDAARRGILEDRSKQVKEVRARALERVQREKDAIAQEAAAARTQLEASVPVLAAEMVRRLITIQPNIDTARGSQSEAR
jgi:F0F1-type ATP synthase membrane subunit b/b'